MLSRRSISLSQSVSSGSIDSSDEIFPEKDVKIGIVGGVNTGKSTLVEQFTKGVKNNCFDQRDMYTQHVSTFNTSLSCHTNFIGCKKGCAHFNIWWGSSKQTQGKLSEYNTDFITDDCFAIIFIFDLTNMESLCRVKKWYKKSRKKYSRWLKFLPILLGTKYDVFKKCDIKYKYDLTNKARYFSINMGASLIYCNNFNPNDVFKPFKFIMSKLYDLDIKFTENHNEFVDTIFEAPKKYEKLSKRKTDEMEVLGYIRRSLGNKNYNQDFSYIIVRYYVNLDQWMAAVNRKCKKRKKRRSKKLNAKEQKRMMAIDGQDLKFLLAPESSHSWSTDISTDIGTDMNDINIDQPFWSSLI